MLRILSLRTKKCIYINDPKDRWRLEEGKVLRSDLPARSHGALAFPLAKSTNVLGVAGFWISFTMVTVLAGAIYVQVAPSPDQSIFDYMAWLDVHGVPFYKDSFDMTWPGQLVFHELGVRAFGVRPWTARATDFVLLQPAILAIYVYICRCGFPRAAAAAALLYPIIYATSGIWMTGLRDLTGAHFLIGAAIFALPSEKRSIRHPILSGFLGGYATMIRPTYLAFAPMLLLLALPNWAGPQLRLTRVAKEAGLFVAGLLITPLLFAFYAISTNTFHDWYLDSIKFVFDVYFAPQPLGRVIGRLATVFLKNLWWLTIAATLGSLLWVLFGRCRRGFFLLAAMAATFVVSYFVQNKAFVYHLAGVIPVLLMLGCAGAEAGLDFPLRSAPLRANVIQNESGPNDTFFQWGWQYQVSFLAQRRSPTRIINTPGASAIRPGQPIFGAWLTQFDRDLRDHPPKFILVDETVIVPGSFKLVPARAGTMLDILERHIAKGYIIRDQRNNVTLLKR